jgi:ubiquinone/menaquinone biosynthesis C-methylase UbiE/ADP-ribose pyrophosphatase YjhB (NUDIX family)
MRHEHIMKHRACGALIRGEKILMVRHSHGGEDYWTLPGGGVEAGELHPDAAVREMREETGLVTRAVRLLWEERGSAGGIQRCFLMADAFEGQDAVLGADPEETDLPSERRLLKEIRWFPIVEKRSDVQIAKVLTALKNRPPIDATINRGWREAASIHEAFARGEINEAGWHARWAAIIVPTYLSGENPRAQSGYSGTQVDLRQARGLVADAITRSGTFLDVGCANGLLMESVQAWCAERGLVIEPYGVDIASELVALARTRLPKWAARILEGNAAAWLPPFRFDFVRTGDEYVPHTKRRELIAHLLSHVVMPGGRLLIGPYTEEADATRSKPSLEDTVRGWGFEVAGRIERLHPHDDRVVRRLIYIDARRTIASRSAVPYNIREDAYAGTAQDYARFRVQYPSSLLEHVRRRANVSGTGRLLDLGCGPGRVTLPLAPFFRQVWAIDQESEMIEAGAEEAAKFGLSHVRWIAGKAEELQAPLSSFELITMGESFHRFDQSVIIGKALQWLQPGGYLASMGGTNAGKEPWQRAYKEVFARWQPSGAASAHPAARQPTLTSGQIFAAAGLEDISEDEFTTPHVWTVDSLIGNAYSTSVMSRKALGSKAQSFEADVRETLLAINPQNEFPEEVSFWCALGRRPS